ncbi:MAG: hypothetical protein M3040_18450 [Bacteroidota bacterium]|nr:hypothetical protein [Bacteroidota bacterium]
MAQNKQIYRNHEEIEVGGGMKVEILKCSGDGPTEICDCIYFTDKRQNGTRMKQNANQLKTEERAALFAKGVKNPEVKRNGSLALAENRADKTIPKSIIQKPNPKHAQPTLEEAVKRADSVANASSKKMREKLSFEDPGNDSSAMDQVFIPKVTLKGKTRLESATKATTTNNPPDTAVIAVKPTSDVNNVVLTPKTLSIFDSSSKKVTTDKISQPINPFVAVNPGVEEKIVNQKQAINTQIPEIINAPTALGSTIRDTAQKVAVAVKDPTVMRTEPVIKTAAAPTDTIQDTWVKQYNGVKTIPESVGQSANKILPNEIKSSDQARASDNADLKPTDKEESKRSDTFSNKSFSPTAQILDKAEKKLEDSIRVRAAATDQARHLTPQDQQEKNQPNNTLPNIAAATDTTINGGTVGNNKGTISKTSVAATSAKDTSLTSVTPSTAPVMTHNDPVVSTSDANEIKDAVKSEESPLLKNTAAANGNIIGRSAEVNAKGEWEKVTIIDKETEFLYKVHYLGSSADHDEWISVTQIRNIDSAAPTIIASNHGTEKPVNKPTKISLNCSFEAPAPPVANGDKFSEKIAKRKIYEQYVLDNKNNNTMKTGVTFLSFELESPYVNTVSISPTNTLDIKVSFAPAGAMIYPVKTQYKVCEQVLGRTSSKTVSSDYACYRNKEGAWTCTNMK